MHWQIASIILVMSAVALQWYSHSDNLLVTHDSCSYISASVSFETSFAFINYDGTRYAYWPPLFPVILSLFGESWYWMQLLMTAWIGALVIIQTRRIIEGPLMQLLCQASILLGVHLLLIGTFLWSELLFLLILFHFMIALEKNQFIAAIILGFLLCLQRNAGLFFVIAAVLWYGKDFKRSTILFLVSTSGFWIWNIYTSTLRQEYFVHSIFNFEVMSTSMVHALAPVGYLNSIIFIAMLVVIGWLLMSDIKTKPVVRLWCISVVTYLAGLTVLFKLLVDDGDRYAAIVIAFFMILVFRAIEIVASKQTSVVRNLLIILIMCWMVYPLSRTIKNAFQWHAVSFKSSCNNYE